MSEGFDLSASTSSSQLPSQGHLQTTGSVGPGSHRGFEPTWHTTSSRAVAPGSQAAIPRRRGDHSASRSSRKHAAAAPQKAIAANTSEEELLAALEQELFSGSTAVAAPRSPIPLQDFVPSGIYDMQGFQNIGYTASHCTSLFGEVARGSENCDLAGPTNQERGSKSSALADPNSREWGSENGVLADPDGKARGSKNSVLADPASVDFESERAFVEPLTSTTRSTLVGPPTSMTRPSAVVVEPPTSMTRPSVEGVGPSTSMARPSVVGASPSSTMHSLLPSQSRPVAYDPSSHPWSPTLASVASGQAGWISFGEPIPLHDIDIQMEPKSPVAVDESMNEINGVDPVLVATSSHRRPVHRLQ